MKLLKRYLKQGLQWFHGFRKRALFIKPWCLMQYKRVVKRMQIIRKLTGYQDKAKGLRLPWFMMIGLSGEGKTELLQQSGLYRLKQCEPDETLEWWFSNDAVVVDIPGLSVSDKEMQADWLERFKKLKRFKTRRRLKGILLIISCDTLLKSQSLGDVFDHIAQSIDLLYQAIGFKLPVYWLVTQCDQLPGFQPFFSQMTSQAREQAWGMSIASKAPLHEEISQGIDRLYERLLTRISPQIHLLDNAVEQLQFLLLPQQFLKLKGPLLGLVDKLCGQTVYQDSMFLCGVYFTSAAQSKTDKQGYFIHDVLKQRILTPPSMTQACQSRKRQQHWIYRGQVAALFLVFFSALITLIGAYTNHSGVLHNGREIAHDLMTLSALQDNTLPSPQALEAVAGHVDILRHIKERYPWYQRLGMAWPDTQLDVYESVLARIMDEGFYVPMKRYLHEALEKDHHRWTAAGLQDRESLRGRYYTNLKLYLMLYFPKYLEPEFAADILASAWHPKQSSFKALQATQSPLSKRLIRPYLEYLKQASPTIRHDVPYDASIIAKARRDLRTTSGISNLYGSIEQHLLKRLAFLTSDAFMTETEADSWRSDYPLPSMYSAICYLNVVKPCFIKQTQNNPNQDWVIHAPLTRLVKSTPLMLSKPLDKVQQEKLVNELNVLYFTRYLNHWSSFMASIKTAPFLSFEEASQQLKMLSHEAGGFQRWLFVFREQFDLKSMLSRTAYAALPETIRFSFQELHDFMTVSGQETTLIASYLKQLSVLRQEVEALGMSTISQQMPETYVVRLLNHEGNDSALYQSVLLIDKTTSHLKSRAARKAVTQWLLSPVQATFQMMLNDTTSHLQQIWREMIIVPYRQRLADFFPFNHHGQEASPGELYTFFKPGTGLFARFIERLQPFVRFEHKRYFVKSWLGVDVMFSARFLETITTIQQVSSDLFATTNDAVFHYKIYPVPTPGIKEMLFGSNGKQYAYRNGPQEWVSLSWSTQDIMEQEAFIRMTDTTSDAQLVKEYQGPWAFFHLLKSASSALKTSQGYRMAWSFKSGKRLKSVQLILASKTNSPVLEVLWFHPLQLPDTILKTG